MRYIKDRHGEKLYCVREDGTITDRWDIDIIGHIHEDCIKDKWDMEVLYRIKPDGRIMDKWDLELIGHWHEDGEFTDKWDLEHFGSLERSTSSTETESATNAYNSSFPSNRPRVTYSKEVHFQQKEAHPFIGIIVSALLFLFVFIISFLLFEKKWVSLYIASLFAIPTFLIIGRNNVERKANGDVIGRRGGSFYFWGIVRGLFFYGPFSALIIGLIFRTPIAVYVGAMLGYTIGVLNGEYN